MRVNASITVYRYKDGTYERNYIPSCFFMDCIKDSVGRAGEISENGITVYIPISSLASAPHTPGKDFIVKGNCPFSFAGTSQQAVSAEFKLFRETCQIYAVDTVSVKNYGDELLRHIKITAR